MAALLPPANKAATQPPHCNCNLYSHIPPQPPLTACGDVESNPGPAPRWPCAVCQLGVGSNSIVCTLCHRWVHRRCCQLPVRTTLARAAPTYKCPPCSHNQQQNPIIPQQQQATNNRRNRPIAPRRHKLRRWRARRLATIPGQFLNILHANVDGLTVTKLAELDQLAHEHQPDIIALQEVKLAGETNRTLAGYAFIHVPRRANPTKGGGVAMFVRSSLQWIQLTGPSPVAHGDTSTEWCGITITTSQGPLNVFNIYRPPGRSGPDHYNPASLPATNRTAVVGDLNARHTLWDGSGVVNTAGQDLADYLASSSLTSINNPAQHTHNARSTGAPGSPDVSLVSADLVGLSNWTTSPPVGSSDHLCVWLRIDFVPSIPAPTCIKPRPNFKKASWPLYQQHISRQLANETNLTLDMLTNAIIKASSHAIPLRKAPRRRRPAPWFDDDCKEAVAQRNLLQATQAQSAVQKAAYTAAAHNANEVILQAKRKHHREVASAFDIKTRPSALFQHIRTMDGRSTVPAPQGITLRSGRTVHGQAKADEYAKTYRSFSNLLPSLARSKRQITRQNRKLLAHKQSHDAAPVQPFSMTELKHALSKLKFGKAPGPDGVCTEHLTHLPTDALHVARRLISQAITEGPVPPSWRIATVVPIIKKGKPPNQLSSYRPISLTSTISKLAERLVLRRLQPLLHTLSPEQAGFRPHRSCEDQVARLSQSVYEGMDCRQRLRTVLATVDYAKAFDSVPLHLLFQRLHNFNTPPYIIRFLVNFLQNRSINARFDNHMSHTMQLVNGLPQGAVLSPALFTIYIDPLLAAIKAQDAQVSAFADDVAIWCQGKTPEEAQAKLQPALDVVTSWSTAHGLSLSVEKCTGTLFTRNAYESDFTTTLHINNQPIPHCNNPTFLGVVFDRLLSFTAHANYVAKSTSSRLRALSTLAGRDWGQDETTLRQVAQATIVSKVDYGCAIYGTFGCESAARTVQRSINTAARTVTGCTASTPVGPLLNEAGLRPFAVTAPLRAAALAERSLRVHNHPLAPLTAPPPRRRIKAPCWRDKAHSLTADAGLLNLPREPFTIPTPDNNFINDNDNITFHCSNIAKNLPAENRRTSAEVFINNLPTLINGASLYTDGSALDGHLNGGSGGVLLIDGAVHPFSAAAGEFCSSYVAETRALRHGLELASQHRQSFASLRVLTDSLSAVTRLSQGPLSQDSSDEEAVWRLLIALDCRIQVVHIPAHVGIPGNEQADAEAARGSQLDQSQLPLHFATAVAALKHTSRTAHNINIRGINHTSTSTQRYWHLIDNQQHQQQHQLHRIHPFTCGARRVSWGAASPLRRSEMDSTQMVSRSDGCCVFGRPGVQYGALPLVPASTRRRCGVKPRPR